MGRRSATAMCLLGALLCAMLGTGDVGGAEASLVHGGTRGGGLFSRYRSSSTSSYFRSLRRLASVAVGRNLALFTLWPTSGAPPFAALAASHLRVDPSTGLIVELPESEIAEDVVAFHTPVQHPGGQRPGRCELVSCDFLFSVSLSAALLEFIYISQSIHSRVSLSRMTASMRAVRCGNSAIHLRGECASMVLACCFTQGVSSWAGQGPTNTPARNEGGWRLWAGSRKPPPHTHNTVSGSSASSACVNREIETGSV